MEKKLAERGAGPWGVAVNETGLTDVALVPPA